MSVDVVDVEIEKFGRLDPSQIDMWVLKRMVPNRCSMKEKYLQVCSTMFEVDGVLKVVNAPKKTMIKEEEWSREVLEKWVADACDQSRQACCLVVRVNVKLTFHSVVRATERQASDLH